MLKLFSSIYCSLHLIYFYFLYSCYYHIVAQFEITGSWNDFYPLSPDLEGNRVTVHCWPSIQRHSYLKNHVIGCHSFFFFKSEPPGLPFGGLLSSHMAQKPLRWVMFGLDQSPCFSHHTLQFSMKTFINFWSSSPFSFFRNNLPLLILMRILLFLSHLVKQKHLLLFICKSQGNFYFLLHSGKSC